MKSDLLQHKGYYGSVRYSSEDDCLYGRVEFIDDLILYDGETVKDIKAAFAEAVDDYISSCAERGVKPNSTCKGSFNVRIGEDLHKEIAVEAMKLDISLNEFVRQTLHARMHSPDASAFARSVFQQVTSGLSKTNQVIIQTSWPDEGDTVRVLTPMTINSEVKPWPNPQTRH